MHEQHIPDEAIDPRIPALEKTLERLKHVDIERQRLVEEIIALKDSDDPRTHGILDAATYVKTADYNGRSLDHAEVTTRQSPIELATKVAAFEDAIRDPQTPVLVIGRDYRYHPERLKLGLLDGEITYPQNKDGYTFISTSNTPETYVTFSEASRAQYDATEEEPINEPRGIYVGEPAIANLLLRMQPGESEYPVPKLWNIAEICGVLAEAGVHMPTKHGEIATLFANNEHKLTRAADQILRLGIILTIADEDEHRGITSKPQKRNVSSVPELIWDRDQELERLITRTIPAVNVLGLGHTVLDTIANIDKPIVKHSKLTGIDVEMHDPNQCFPNGLSEPEAVRRSELQSQLAESITV